MTVQVLPLLKGPIGAGPNGLADVRVARATKIACERMECMALVDLALATSEMLFGRLRIIVETGNSNNTTRRVFWP